jgi:hypothetical protein
MTVAGTGKLGYAGDGGPAALAHFNGIHGLAFDAAGSFYLADYNNHRIRKVSVDGTVTTIAGTGKPGYSGDNGKAIEARINSPHDVTIDGAGNIYIADLFNHRVRKVSPDGIIITVAGTGKMGYSGDGGPAVKAQLNFPAGLAVDAEENLSIAEFSNHTVRQVTPDGIISTVAGSGKQGFSGDEGPAFNARLNSPESVTVDAAGNLYIGCLFNNRVRKVTRDGIIHLVAGIGPDGLGTGRTDWPWTPPATCSSPRSSTTGCARSPRTGPSPPSSAPGRWAAAGRRAGFPTPVREDRSPTPGWSGLTAWRSTPQATC